MPHTPYSAWSQFVHEQARVDDSGDDAKIAEFTYG